MRLRFLLPALVIAALLSGSALAYTYTIMREDIGRVIFPSYTTIIPTDSPLRNSAPSDVCNGGFSPNPCGQVGTIPEPGTYALFGLGLLMMLVMRLRGEES